MPRCPTLPVVLALAAITLSTSPATAQWTNRYPKVAGYAHHVYLEGYELPLLTVGPIDARPSPVSSDVVFASRGWLWRFDPAVGVARRITAGGGIDARPAWSPDGRQLAFVRDDTRRTTIVLLDLERGTERVVVGDSAINLDPAFSPDGGSLFYSSSAAGDLDLWRLDLGSMTKSRITETAGLELHPIPAGPTRELIYVGKQAGDAIRARHLDTGAERVLASGSILSMLRMAMAPDGRTLAYTWPASDASGWELRLLAVDAPTSSIGLVTRPGALPLTPAWSGDGRFVYYSEADAAERMVLHRVGLGGGPVERVDVGSWDWGAATGTLRVTTRLAGTRSPAPARIGAVDANGHPLVPDTGQPRFDGQTGQVFFYSAGVVELTVPAGEVTVQAVQGLATPVVRRRVAVRPGEVAALELELTPVWDARARGWLAGEHHFHLNYGGPYRLDPEDLLPMARAEAMDVVTPLLANLHTRFEDQPLWTWTHLSERPFVAFGQEVRSHFLGHLGLVGTPELFWPWIWGPGYQVYGRDDRPNAEVTDFARRQGGVSTYVHPIMRPGPFAPDQIGAIPVSVVADGVLGAFDALEVACLWSDEIGSMELWYRLLDLGRPVALTAGTDVMNDFYRTMAIGTTRVYVRGDSTTGYRDYLHRLAQGQSVVTTGPMLELTVDGSGPGDVLPRGDREVRWSLAVHSAMALDSVEIMLNGRTVSRLDGLTGPGSRTYEGRIRLPAGGWVAARTIGGRTTEWPAMDSYAFAHTSPVWIGARGSTVPDRRRAAAADLLRAIDNAEARLRQAYGSTPTPALSARFEQARAHLTAVLSR